MHVIYAKWLHNIKIFKGYRTKWKKNLEKIN